MQAIIRDWPDETHFVASRDWIERIEPIKTELAFVAVAIVAAAVFIILILKCHRTYRIESADEVEIARLENLTAIENAKKYEYRDDS